MLLLILALFAATVPAHGCTGFVLRTDEGPIFARNMDLPFVPAVLVTNVPGVSRRAYGSTRRERLRWVSRYRSVTLNHVGEGFPNEGMNDQGLVVAPFSLYPNRGYPGDDGLPAINEFQWMQYQLDVHRSTAEVVRSLAHHTFDRMVLSNAIQFLICDPESCVVIESTGTALRVHDLSRLPAIANAAYLDSVAWLGGGPGAPQDLITGRRFRIAAETAMERSDGNAGQGRSFAWEALTRAAQAVTQFHLLYEPGSATLRIRRPNGRVGIVRRVGTDSGALELPASFAHLRSTQDRVFHCKEFLRLVHQTNERSARVASFIERGGS